MLIAGGTIAPSGSLVAGVVTLLVTFGVMGFIGGVAFSLVLGIAEGRRRFDQMSLPSVCRLGSGGGLLLSMLMFTAGSGFQMELGELIILGILPLLGAGSAAGSLALARRADDRELLEHGADVADIGLTEEEKRELLAG